MEAIFVVVLLVVLALAYGSARRAKSRSGQTGRSSGGLRVTISYPDRSKSAWPRRSARQPLKSKALRISSLPEEFVVFDLETTGLSPHSDEILEIGAIKVNRDSNVSSGLARCQTFQTLVKPSGHIPAMITKINGISEQMVDKDGESIETALKGFMSFVGSSACFL